MRKIIYSDTDSLVTEVPLKKDIFFLKYFNL